MEEKAKKVTCIYGNKNTVRMLRTENKKEENIDSYNRRMNNRNIRSQE